VKQKYITLLPISLLALSASYGIYSFSLLFVPWYIAGITALAFELTYCTLVFIDSTKAKPVSIMAVIVSVLWNVGHSMFVLFPASVEMVYNSLLLSFILAAIHGIPLATLAYLVADVSLHSETKKEMSETYSGEYITEMEMDREISEMDMKQDTVLDDDVSHLGNTYEGEVSTEGVTRNERIIQDIEDGMSVKEVSATYGLSERRVRQIVKGL
jgi:hypothetical protein